MFIVNAVTKPFLAGSTPETCWSKLKISADVILNAQLKIVQIFYTVNSCEYFILHIDWTRPCLSPLVKRDLVNSIPGLIYATACFMRGGTPPPLHTELLHVFSPQKGSIRFFWQKISFRHAWLMLSCCNQALTGTRYPTQPGLFFSSPNRTRKFFQNFRVQGSSYICHY